MAKTLKIQVKHVYGKTLFLTSVPFDEDAHDKSVWFLDHDYLECMYGMFKKVNGKLIIFTHSLKCHLEEVVDGQTTWIQNL